jgi:hypothetical protein
MPVEVKYSLDEKHKRTKKEYLLVAVCGALPLLLVGVFGTVEVYFDGLWTLKESLGAIAVWIFLSLVGWPINELITGLLDTYSPVIQISAAILALPIVTLIYYEFQGPIELVPVALVAMIASTAAVQGVFYVAGKGYQTLFELKDEML